MSLIPKLGLIYSWCHQSSSHPLGQHIFQIDLRRGKTAPRVFCSLLSSGQHRTLGALPLRTWSQTFYLLALVC